MAGCECDTQLRHYVSQATVCRGHNSQVREYHAELCVPCGNKLGECPIWDDKRGLICWIDIQGKRLWQHDPDRSPEFAQSVELPARPGSFCISNDGDYVFAFEDGFSFYDPDSQKFSRVTKEFEPHLNTRFNDGRVDPQGRFVVTGCVEKGEEPLSGVYRLNKDLTIDKLKGDVRCGNSICFALDGSMFFADPGFVNAVWQCTPNTIWRFPYYPTLGMTDAEPFAEPDGRPDGSVIDSEGCLWNAEFGRGRIVRYNPNGVVDMIVHVPVRFTTCVAFGGADLRTLFITDASVFAYQRMSRKNREPLPEGYAGGLFRVRLPVSGMPESRFGGTKRDVLRS